jgi:hypothetical protein
MKKIFLISLLALFSAFSAWAQKSNEANEKSPLGENGPAIVIEFEGQAKNVEDVLADKFKKLKSSKTKGFVAMEGQIFTEIGPDMMDIYYKVEKGKENQAKVVMFLSKGYNNWMTGSTNPAEVGNAKKMLDNLVSEVRKYELGIAIAAQEKVLDGATKDQEKLVKDGEGLVKDHQKLEEELAKNKENQELNKKAQEDQKKVIEEEKKVLDELKKKLGSVK